MLLVSMDCPFLIPIDWYVGQWFPSDLETVSSFPVYLEVGKWFPSDLEAVKGFFFMSVSYIDKPVTA